MGSFGKVAPYFASSIDPLAEEKTVIWRPVTTGTALQVGDSVCYCKDAQDHEERSTNPSDRGATYGEGSQNYTGRLYIVEEPLVDNLDQYAGVVSQLGPKAGSDGDTIKIYKPNGAVVPARIAALTTVAGRSILAVKAGQRTLDVPSSDVDDYGYDTEGTAPTRAVGITAEVRTTTGLCWVKLDDRMFINQGENDGDKMLQVPASTSNIAVNKSFIDFKNTDGHCCSWLWRTRLSGTGSGASKGVYRFDVMCDATTYGEYIRGMDINVEVACSASQTPPNHVYGLSVMLRTQSDPNMTTNGCTVAIVNLESFLRKDATAAALTNGPTILTWFRMNSNGEAIDCLMNGPSPAVWGGSNASKTVGRCMGFDTDGLVNSVIKIPIISGGDTYYILAGKALAEATAL